MKKILAALLVLALVAPAFADVAITATDAGSQYLLLSFTTSGSPAPVVRGMALTLTVTGGTITSASNYDTGTPSVFNTFVDYAVGNSGYAIGTGHPFALEHDAGVAALFPINSGTPFAVCVGYLDQTGAKGGKTSGTIAKIKIDGITAGSSATIAISANAARGGAVVGDTLGTVTVPSSASVLGISAETVTLNATPVTKTTASPATAGRVNSGRLETFVGAATSSVGHGLQYQFDWGSGASGVWGSATQTHSFTYTAAATYNVKVQARCATDTDKISAWSAALPQTSECVRSTAAFYSTWNTFGKPNCWGFQRNCRGDADGVGNGGGTSKVWVTSTYLNIFLAGYTKTQTQLLTTSYNGVPGICADNDRAGNGGGASKVWVTSTDLGTFLSYYTKTQTNVPVCPGPASNYWYWTN
jgi:hypothetical protein